MQTFSATECVSYGWDTFKKRPWFLVGAMVIVIILTVVVSSVNADVGNSFIEIFPISVAALILQTLLDMGLTAFTLKAGDDIDTVELADLWHPHSFWSFLITNFIVGIGVVLGLFLVIVPGIILALAWIFVKFLIIDRDMGPEDALKESMRITKGQRYELLILVLLSLGINIIGLLCLVVGVFVTIPVTSLAFVRAYRLLEHQANELVPVEN